MAIINGTPNGETLIGTNAADTINGLAGHDDLRGNDGNDVLDGGEGNDALNGGRGRDRLIGGLGNDSLIDDSTLVESDILLGGDGDDFLLDGGGDDRLDGGIGNDIIVPSGGGNNVISCGDGDDVVGQAFARLGEGLGLDTVTGGAGRDTFWLGAHGVQSGAARTVDVITDFQAGPGGDRLYIDDVLYYVWNRNDNPFLTGHIRLKQSGADTLVQADYDGFGSAYAATTLVKLKNVNAASLTVDNFTHHTSAIAGFAPNDIGLTITGTNATNETLHGTESADIIHAAGGGDTVYGHYGDDIIDGGTGKNILYGGMGSDIITGGSGIDTIYGDGTSLPYTVVDGDDVLDGGAGNDYLDGGEGSDILRGGKGVDQINAGDGSSLDGYADIIVFAAGDTGKDLTKADHILNFESGSDRIDLSAIDAKTATGGIDDAFIFIGTSAFSNVAGQLRYQTVAGTTRIMGDMNGDGLADLMIVIDNGGALTAGDFLL